MIVEYEAVAEGTPFTRIVRVEFTGFFAGLTTTAHRQLEANAGNLKDLLESQ